MEYFVISVIRSILSPYLDYSYTMETWKYEALNSNTCIFLKTGSPKSIKKLMSLNINETIILMKT